MSLICHVTTWSICHLTCGWGPVIQSHHPAKFGVQRPCENGYITFFISHVTTTSKCHVLCGGSPLILSHHTAKFGIHMPYGTGNNDVCNISSNSISNSNSNAELPMPRFTNGQIFRSYVKHFWIFPRGRNCRILIGL